MVRGSWTKKYNPVRMSVPEWHSYLQNLCQSGRKIYIVSQCASDMLTVTGFWVQVSKGKYQVVGADRTQPEQSHRPNKDKRVWVGKLVLSGKTDIVSCRCNGGTIVFVSLTNYVDAPISVLRHSLSNGRTEAHAPTEVTEIQAENSCNTCDIIGAFYRRMIDDWRSLMLGPWRETSGGLAISAWKELDGATASISHKDQYVHEIERACTHGGRASLWFYGAVDTFQSTHCRDGIEMGGARPLLRTSNIQKFDVTSMYTTLLRDRLFPIRMMGVDIDPSVQTLTRAMQHHGVIAVVTMRSEDSEYPVRCVNRTRYPAGRYCTVLASPELELALESHSVIACHRLVRYEMGQPFANFGKTFIDLRSEAKREGDRARELLAKTISNSFGGKFAQSTDTWSVRPNKEAPREWGEWSEHDAQTHLTTRYRATAGVTFERVARSNPGRLPTSVYCFLTSYGRSAMRTIRESVCPINVLLQQTDGLLTHGLSDHSMREMAAVSNGIGLQLRSVGSHNQFRAYGPNHYQLDGEWTLAGIAYGWTLSNSNTVIETRRVNPACSSTRNIPQLIAESTREISLCGIIPECRVSASGWAVPQIHGDDFNDIILPSCMRD